MCVQAVGRAMTDKVQRPAHDERPACGARRSRAPRQGRVGWLDFGSARRPQRGPAPQASIEFGASGHASWRRDARPRAGRASGSSMPACQWLASTAHQHRRPASGKPAAARSSARPAPRRRRVVGPSSRTSGRPAVPGISSQSARPARRRQVPRPIARPVDPRRSAPRPARRGCQRHGRVGAPGADQQADAERFAARWRR